MLVLVLFWFLMSFYAQSFSEKSLLIKNARREAEEEIQRFRAQKEAEHEKLLSMVRLYL